MGTSKLLYKDESFDIVGACMEVHNFLGKGHKEIIYGDALEIEMKRYDIEFSREKKYVVKYKDEILPHKYCADFVVYDIIILEIKAVKQLTSGHIKQTLNYLAASKLRVGILVNFGEDSLVFKRVVL